MDDNKENKSLMEKQPEETQLVPFKSSSTELVPFKQKTENVAFDFINLYRNISKEFVNATADITINTLENVEKVNVKIIDMLVDNAATTLFFTKAAVKGVKEVVEMTGEVGRALFKAFWGTSPKTEAKKDNSLIPINISMNKTEEKAKK